MKLVKHSKSALFLLLLFLIPLQAFAVQKPVPTFQAHVNEFKKVAGGVGIQVVALPSGRVVVEHQPAQPLIPASLVKVLTSYAALKRLGPFHYFQTGIWALREPQNGVITGPIWLRSEGDFFLVGEKAWNLARELKERGVQRIEGGIHIDNSFFAPYSEQLCLDGKCWKPYNPIISATAMEFNTITFRVLPGAQPGHPLQVRWFPSGDYVQLDNQGRTTSQASKSGVQIRSLGLTRDGRERYQVSGALPVTAYKGSEYRMNIASPVGFVAHSFRHLLEQVGIEVRQTDVGSSQTPANAVKLVAFESAPLGDLLYGLNRYSNNFMAEMLMRSLGGTVMGPPGTVEKGVLVIRAVLKELGISEREVFVDCGSGLSRDCKVTSRVFSTVLVNGYNDFSISPEFLASMAVNSQEGTLRKRMRRSGIVVRGKTGSLRDVVGFCGYVSYPGRGVYAVTVLLNEVKNPWEAKQALDSFLDQLPNFALQ